MNTGNQLRVLAESLGADYFGIADLAPAQDFIREQGGEKIARYPRAVVLGITLLDTLVDGLEDGDLPSSILYKHHAYDVVNTALDQIGLRIANTLQRSGYRAFPVPASKRTDDGRICGIFSHKLAAHLAGLGWIGKSCLLVTPDHGPRVRWISVLTDAPLIPTGRAMIQQCGKCTECTEICPVQAITGRAFSEGEPREARLDTAACDRYFKDLEKKQGVGVCGKCLLICPHGRKSR
jgi:epoxyqueuosine reductase